MSILHVIARSVVLILCVCVCVCVHGSRSKVCGRFMYVSVLRASPGFAYVFVCACMQDYVRRACVCMYTCRRINMCIMAPLR
jgi:hypothetical protein